MAEHLVLVSFKNGFNKDISPDTHSSWILVISDPHWILVISDHVLGAFCSESPILHLVKAHDLIAFAASKDFNTGISLDQFYKPAIGSQNNTFTQFYLKDVARAD